MDARDAAAAAERAAAAAERAERDAAAGRRATRTRDTAAAAARAASRAADASRAACNSIENKVAMTDKGGSSANRNHESTQVDGFVLDRLAIGLYDK